MTNQGSLPGTKENSMWSHLHGIEEVRIINVTWLHKCVSLEKEEGSQKSTLEAPRPNRISKHQGDNWDFLAPANWWQCFLNWQLWGPKHKKYLVQIDGWFISAASQWIRYQARLFYPLTKARQQRKLLEVINYWLQDIIY